MRRPILVLLLALLAAGCQKAGRYGGRPAPQAPPPSTPPVAAPVVEAPKEELNPDLLWQDPGFNPPKDDVRIEFVHADASPDEWKKLPQFWNAPLLSSPDQAAALIGLAPLTGGALAADGKAVVKVKVPLGLDDPQSYVPASNPLTLGKWKLGRRLFFDDTWLEAQPGLSCATCHNPKDGFSARQKTHGDGFNAPTLVNSVFNRYQFWDGRASLLEEVVQRGLEDEREVTPAPRFHHAWGGAIRRLRANLSYKDQFTLVFGTPPTADTVGRALATYLRTILAGNSVHDRALQAMNAKGRRVIEPADYEAVLGEAGVLDDLGRSKDGKADVAKELHRGYQLFFSRDEAHRVNCVNCHGGRHFSDGEFHNLGVGLPSFQGREQGRFATVPVGQKNRYLIDAYKTPTLRGLRRTGPYLHDGSGDDLNEVVRTHATRNSYLAPEFLDDKDHVRGEDLKPEEVEALVLFLKALNGDDVDATFRKPPAP